MHASLRRMALASATAIVVVMGPGAAQAADPGGSLSTPIVPKTKDEKKAEKEAKKEAKKAEDDTQQAETDAISATPAVVAASAPQAATRAAEPMRLQQAPAAQESPQNAAAEQVIIEVFGPEQGPTAVRVARCESSMSTNASNGSYAGLFQMGSNERSTYGHGADPRSQAEAAYSYFSRSGWRPWSASRSCWKA